MTYRGSFFLNMFLVSIESLTVFVANTLLFKHITTIAGWSYHDMLVLSGVFMTMHAVSWLLFRGGINQLDVMINKGDLDWLLVKPADTQFLATMYIIDLEDAARSVVGIILIIAGLQGTPFLHILPLIPLFIFTLLCGQIVLYSVSLSIKTISFKSIQGWATNAIYFRFLDLARYPTDIYHGFMRVVYTFIFPLAFLATVPAKTLLGRLTPTYFVLSIILAASTFTISRYIWKWALSKYSSASS